MYVRSISPDNIESLGYAPNFKILNYVYSEKIATTKFSFTFSFSQKLFDLIFNIWLFT